MKEVNRLFSSAKEMIEGGIDRDLGYEFLDNAIDCINYANTLINTPEEDTDGIIYDVPVYNQKIGGGCVFVCEKMINDSNSGIIRTDDEVAIAEREAYVANGNSGAGIITYPTLNTKVGYTYNDVLALLKENGSLHGIYKKRTTGYQHDVVIRGAYKINNVEYYVINNPSCDTGPYVINNLNSGYINRDYGYFSDGTRNRSLNDAEIIGIYAQQDIKYL